MIFFWNFSTKKPKYRIDTGLRQDEKKLFFFFFFYSPLIFQDIYDISANAYLLRFGYFSEPFLHPSRQCHAELVSVFGCPSQLLTLFQVGVLLGADLESALPHMTNRDGALLKLSHPILLRGLSIHAFDDSEYALATLYHLSINDIRTFRLLPRLLHKIDVIL